jgi:hypothetical protein
MGDKIKTSDHKQQFVTSMKNGKVGIFRAQTTLAELAELLKGQIKIDSTNYDTAVVGDFIEVYFRRESVSRVKFKFYSYATGVSWLKSLNLGWIVLLGAQSFNEIRKILIEGGLKFKIIEYDTEESAILISKSHVQFIIFFDADGSIEQADLDFERSCRILDGIKTFSTSSK